MIRKDEIDLWQAVELGIRPRAAGEMLGIPSKRVVYLCLKWARLGKYDYGVNADLGWKVGD